MTGEDEYGHYCRPKLVRFLDAIGLGATYERAEGNWLWRRTGETLTRTLDLIGGFGANLFGHYHPELVAEDARILAAQTPLLAQGSRRVAAGKLAKALADRLGDYVAIFTNSGTETVEAALKHAALETGRSAFWAVERGFHGKTLGSIQLTWSFREPYEGLGPRVHFLDPFDPASWERAEAQAPQIAAAVVEPVLGEGGVRPLPAAFVDWLAATCRRANIPLVADEVQTGFGRTGKLTASENWAVRPDYICLSKSLGGGLTKIGALLVRRDRLVEDFPLRHTSTFAEDERSCGVALKALEILEREDLAGMCRDKGARWIERLRAIAAEYPDVITEVRGVGLLIGIELRDQSESPSNTFRMLSCQDFFGYMAAAYLLNVHNVRVAPTLTDPLTLRVAPSAYVTEQELDLFAGALRQMCEAMRCLDVVHLTGHLTGHVSGPPTPFTPRRASRRDSPQTPRRVAFIGHLLDSADAVLWDPRLTALPSAHLRAFMERPSRVLGPTIFDQLNVSSDTGAMVHLSYIGLDLTPRQIWDAIRANDIGWVRGKVHDAIEMARDEGCRVVGLGGYTSMVVSRWKDGGIEVTSGNALTVGMGAAAISRTIEARGIDLRTATMGIVGGAGNIGSVYATAMAPQVPELILVVRDPSTPRAQATFDALRRQAPATRLSMTADLGELRRCHIVMSASNSPDPIIQPEHVSDTTAVICDISLPGDVAPTVREAWPDTPVIQGGIVALPHNPDFLIAGLPLQPGEVYACLAETLLIGFEDEGPWRGRLGPLAIGDVRRAMALAEKHGFDLGGTNAKGEERVTPVKIVGGLAAAFAEAYGHAAPPPRDL